MPLILTATDILVVTGFVAHSTAAVRLTLHDAPP